MNKNHQSKKAAFENSNGVAILPKKVIDKVEDDSWLNERGRNPKPLKPFYNICPLEAEMVARYHGKAMKAHQSALKYAKVAGKFLIHAKKKVGYGRFKGFLEQIRPKIGQTTASLYMRIAKRWEELEHDPEMSIREAMKTLTSRTRTKKFNPDDILCSKAFKAFLRTAWEDWTQIEIEYFQFNLAFDPELAELVMEAMKKVKWAIRREMKSLTKEDRRELTEIARKNMQRMTLAYQTALDSYVEQSDKSLRLRPLNELI